MGCLELFIFENGQPMTTPPPKLYFWAFRLTVKCKQLLSFTNYSHTFTYDLGFSTKERTINFLFFYFVQHQHKYKLGGWLNFGVSQRLGLRFWAQLVLDIVDQMWVEFRMGSWGFTMFWGGSILRDYIFFILDLDLLGSTNAMGALGFYGSYLQSVDRRRDSAHEDGWPTL